MLPATLQRTLRYALLASQRIQDAIRRVDAIEILGDLSAQKALRDWLRRVALHLYGTPFLIYGHQHSARIRTVVRADCVDDSERRRSGDKRHELIVSRIEVSSCHAQR